MTVTCKSVQRKIYLKNSRLVMGILLNFQYMVYKLQFNGLIAKYLARDGYEN
jgi:hypothetical protein